MYLVKEEIISICIKRIIFKIHYKLYVKIKQKTALQQLFDKKNLS